MLLRREGGKSRVAMQSLNRNIGALKEPTTSNPSAELAKLLNAKNT